MSIHRIGPNVSASAPVARDVNRPWTITTARELATFFLWSVERRTELPKDYEDDPRVDPIVAALARLDIHQIDRTLGAGSFGVASRTLRGQVLKLTADPAEVKVGATLIGKDLPHVVNIFGAWFIRGVELKMAYKVDENGSPVFKKFQAGILIEQEVDEIPRGLRKELSKFVMVWKDDTSNHPKHYEHLPEHVKREKLRAASLDLSANLRAEAEMFDDIGVADSAKLFRGVASALSELRGVGVYAIDVHGGNVGLDTEAMRYRVFDVGVGSPPPDARQPEVLDAPPPGKQEESMTTRRQGRKPILPPPGGIQPFVDPAQLQRPKPPTGPGGPEPEQISLFREGLHVAEAVLGREVVVGEL